jgi:hypothetical protein
MKSNSSKMPASCVVSDVRSASALAAVSDSLEKSNTSSLSSRRMATLFSHSTSDVLDAPTMSGMNAGQFAGHSCFRICGAAAARSL